MPFCSYGFTGTEQNSVVRHLCEVEGADVRWNDIYAKSQERPEFLIEIFTDDIKADSAVLLAM